MTLSLWWLVFVSLSGALWRCGSGGVAKFVIAMHLAAGKDRIPYPTHDIPATLLPCTGAAFSITEQRLRSTYCSHCKCLVSLTFFMCIRNTCFCIRSMEVEDLGESQSMPCMCAWMNQHIFYYFCYYYAWCCFGISIADAIFLSTVVFCF